MLRNYLSVMLRGARRQMVFTGINLVGLSIGLTCCILIGLYIQDELLYDAWHSKGDRIYRVIMETRSGDQLTFNERTSAKLTAKLGLVLKTEYPEIEDVVRLHRWAQWVSVGDGEASQLRVCHTDANALELLDFPLIHGDVSSALVEDGMVVLTERMAVRLFGTRDVIGQSVTIKGHEYTITGLLRDLPRQSSIQFDVLYRTRNTSVWKWTSWDSGVRKEVETFVLLKEGAHLAKLSGAFPSWDTERFGEKAGLNVWYRLQPLRRIHLHSGEDFGITAESHGGEPLVHGDIQSLYLFGILGLLILSIAAVNFVNLTTARSTVRSREVALRRTVGAIRGQLVGQFLGESVVLSSGALVLALVFLHISLPIVSGFLDRELSVGGFWQLVVITATTVMIGVIAGCYPAFVLSRVMPVTVLRGAYSASRGSALRRVLVFAQFATAIVLMAVTWGVHSQQAFMRGRSTGFDTEQILELPIFDLAGDNDRVNGWRFVNAYNDVKDAFLAHPNILRATSSRGPMGEWAALVRLKHDRQDPWFADLIGVDEDFVPFYGLDLKMGRNFTRFYAQTTNTRRRDEGLAEEFIVNEAAVAALGWEDPLGMRLAWNVGGDFFPGGLRRGHVIGVVGDFHVKSLHEEIAPLVLVAELKNTQKLYLKIRPDGIPETLAFGEEVWKRYMPNRPFTFSFLDERLDRLYESETKLSQLFSVFAGLSVIVACLGLFGLSVLDAGRRTREIGIRKVLGATVQSVVALIGRDFVKLVLAAYLVACPIAWFTLGAWLEAFPYRIDLEPGTFIALGFVATLIALGTVGWQTVRAAMADPAQVLRTE